VPGDAFFQGLEQMQAFGGSVHHRDGDSPG
jgi:hypothetical protein